MTKPIEARIFAACLTLSFALATTGCNATGVQAFSATFQAAAHSDAAPAIVQPRSATVSFIPQAADRPHHHVAPWKPVLLVEGNHHQRKMGLQASNTRHGIEAQAFTPVEADTTGVTSSLNAQ